MEQSHSEGQAGGAVKKYNGMHFELHGNLTLPVTLLPLSPLPPLCLSPWQLEAQEHYYGL